MGQDAKQGLFACKITVKNGRIEVALTGEHYSPDERGVALAMARTDGAYSAANGGSPVYLVKDSVIGVAVRLYKRGLRHDASGCHDGPKGKPCGKCERCKATAGEQFAMVVLGSLDLPECGGLSERLVDAVESAIGLTWTDAPWARAMNDKEVERVFDTLEIKQDRKER